MSVTLAKTKTMYKVTAWDVKTDRFSGLVYSQKIVMDKMAEADWYTVEMKFFYRDHKPMDGMTYCKVEVQA